MYKIWWFFPFFTSTNKKQHLIHKKQEIFENDPKITDKTWNSCFFAAVDA